jgi:hypothetical protein
VHARFARAKADGLAASNITAVARLYDVGPRAFSSEVDTGSREENASKQETRASVLIQSEPILL